MPITNAFASVPARDFDSSLQWYRKLFGRPADESPVSEVAEWKFEGGGRLQLYQSAERAGFGSFTLAVRSLDEQVLELRKLGLDAGPPMISATSRVVMIKDPDENSIAFSEVRA